MQSVEELLAAGDGAPGGAMLIMLIMLIMFIVLALRPFIVEVEDVGGKLPVARAHHPTWLLKSGDQKVDAGVDA